MNCTNTSIITLNRGKPQILPIQFFINDELIDINNKTIQLLICSMDYEDWFNNSWEWVQLFKEILIHETSTCATFSLSSDDTMIPKWRYRRRVKAIDALWTLPPLWTNIYDLIVEP